MDGDAPKYYYVSAIEDGKHPYLLAGPCRYHALALVMAAHVNEVACQMDPRALFMAFGTAGNNDKRTTPLGVVLVRPGPILGVMCMAVIEQHRAWYDAMHRLAGYTAEEICATHYPGQYGMAGEACRARCREISTWVQGRGVDSLRILEELKNPQRLLYAAGYKTADGMTHYFAGPGPSLQAHRVIAPPDDMPPDARAYLVKLENNTVTPVARWDGQQWVRKKERV